ncbi:MAG: GNAT family N-acetyltransferase [Thermoplasmata archaeon]|nr:MAG: GNAT family N-acetyltransferase [Thermoplasmata archaeon]
MNKNWLIRNYEDGDEDKINTLLNFVYKINRSLSYWYWEFKGNPEGSKILLAVDESNIVGHLASLKRKIKIHESEILASLEVEGVTHPKYGRQGIFVTLGQKMLSESKKEGIDIVYGFPNENALPGHRKLKCFEIFSLHVMIRPVDFKKVSQKMFSNRILVFFANLAGRAAFKVFYRPKRPHYDDMVIKTITQFDSRTDDLWKEAQAAHDIILRRDSTYLNWRYTQCPEKHYKIFVAEKDNILLAWVVVRILEKFGLNNGAIVDLLASPNQKEAVHALILKAMEDLQQEGVDLMACSIPKSSDYYKILKKCGFITCPKNLNPKEEPFIIYPLSEELNLEFVKEPANWFITWGDTDVV